MCGPGRLRQRSCWVVKTYWQALGSNIPTSWCRRPAGPRTFLCCSPRQRLIRWTQRRLLEHLAAQQTSWSWAARCRSYLCAGVRVVSSTSFSQATTSIMKTRQRIIVRGGGHTEKHRSRCRRLSGLVAVARHLETDRSQCHLGNEVQGGCCSGLLLWISQIKTTTNLK